MVTKPSKIPLRENWKSINFSKNYFHRDNFDGFPSRSQWSNASRQGEKRARDCRAIN